MLMKKSMGGSLASKEIVPNKESLIIFEEKELSGSGLNYSPEKKFERRNGIREGSPL